MRVSITKQKIKCQVTANVTIVVMYVELGYRRPFAPHKINKQVCCYMFVYVCCVVSDEKLFCVC